ncbi:unnamed protein product, partial [Hymenolepis diminuta]
MEIDTFCRSFRRWQSGHPNLFISVSHVSLSVSPRDDRHLFRYLCANTQAHGGTNC